MSIVKRGEKASHVLVNLVTQQHSKDPADRNHWIVDPEAAAVVKRIFEMCVNGMGPGAIATRLHEEKVVREIILQLLRETNGYIREHEDEFIALVREKSALKQGETAKSYQKQIAKNERRIAELEKIFRSLYEDKALGRLDAERFEEMSAGYEQEKSQLKSQAAALQAELDAFTADSASAEQFVGLVHRYTDFEVLTPAMINEFVDKIVVHEGEWSDGRNPKTGRGLGTRTQRVEVYLKCIGAFNVPDLRTPEEIEAERDRQERLDRERKYKREYGRRRTVEQKRSPDRQEGSPRREYRFQIIIESR